MRLNLLAVVTFGATLAAQNFALELSGRTVVSVPHHAIMHTGATATIEAWVRASTPPPGGDYVLMHRYADGAEHKEFALNPDGGVYFLYAGSPWAPARGTVTPPGLFRFDGSWQHLAFTRHSDGTYEVSVDGVRRFSGGPGPCWATCNIIQGIAPTRIVCETSGTYSIARLRVSSIDRYRGNFTPARIWVSDAQTALLMQFREGQGATTRDEGPAQQVGTITGAYRWVPFEGPTATTSPFGVACPGTTGVPALSALNNPVWGQVFQMRVDNAPTNSSSAFLLGLSNTTWGGQSLPLDLTGAGMTSCKLYVSLDYIGYVSTGPSGWFQMGLPIARDPALVGWTFYTQFAIVDLRANPLGVTTTGALQNLIGF